MATRRGLATTDARNRTDGWINSCTKPRPDGKPCNIFYWYASYKQARYTIGPDGEPTRTPHGCRVVDGFEEPSQQANL